MSDVKSYTFGGKTWEQRCLVYGQVEQLVELLRTVEMPEQLDFQSILASLGSKLPVALAIILTEQGQSPAGKNLDALAAEIKFAIPAPLIEEVIADFFALTPVTRLIEAATGALQGLLAFRSGLLPSPGESSASLSSSAEAT